MSACDCKCKTSKAANDVNDGGEAKNSSGSDVATNTTKKKCNCGRKVCKETCSSRPCYKGGSLEGIAAQQMSQLISCGCDTLSCNETCSRKPCSEKTQLKGEECTREAPKIKPSVLTNKSSKPSVRVVESVKLADEGNEKKAKTICDICKCIMPCNSDCEKKKKTKTVCEICDCEANKIAKSSNDPKKICEICKCTMPCNNDCEAKKIAKASNEAKKICEICKCTMPCNNDCDAKKRAKASNEAKKICEICKCTMPCNNDCEIKKKTKAQENIKPSELSVDLIKTTDKTSKPSVGVIEASADAESAKLVKDAESKASRTPDINQICEICKCTIPGNSNCEFTKKVNAKNICEVCKCTLTCNEDCETKKIAQTSNETKKICEICKCTMPCNNDCEVKQKTKAKESIKTLEQTDDIIKTDKSSKSSKPSVVFTEADSLNKSVQSVHDKGEGIHNEAKKICEICKCITPCNNDCEIKKKKVQESSHVIKTTDAIESEHDVLPEEVNEQSIAGPIEALVDAKNSKSAESNATRINDGGEAKVNVSTNSKKKCSCGRKVCKEFCSGRPCYKGGSSEGIDAQRMLELISCGCKKQICDETCTKKPCSEKTQHKGEECAREEPNIQPPPLTDDLLKSPDKSSEKICEICKCTTPCKNDCEAKKKAKASSEAKKICEICKCIMPCNNDCEAKKIIAKASRETKKICEICKCTMPCNNDCENKKKIKSQENIKTSELTVDSIKTTDESSKVPVGAIESSTDAEKSAKLAEKTSNASKKICEICKCTLPCNNDCEAKKIIAKASRETKKICEICKCTMPCNNDCENKKKIKSQENIKTSELTVDSIKTTDESSKVPVGAIESSTDAEKSAKLAEKTSNASKKICEICKCTMPCKNDCEAKKLAKASNESKKICDICKCTIPCNNDCESKKKTNAPNETKKICEICKCTMPCNNDCENKKNIKSQENIEPPDLTVESIKTTDESSKLSVGVTEVSADVAKKICDICKCAPCKNDCEAKKIANAPSETKKICEICKCTMPCNNDCENKKKTKSQENIKSSELIVDSIKTTDKSSKLSVGVIEASVDAEDAKLSGKTSNAAKKICEICKCTMPCNNDCEAKKKANAPNEAKKICDICKCTIPCNNDCEAKKKANAPNEVKKICEICKCTIPCNNDCEAKKKANAPNEAKKICDVCKCTLPCNNDCEIKKKTKAQENIKPSEPTVDLIKTAYESSKLSVGVIEASADADSTKLAEEVNEETIALPIETPVDAKNTKSEEIKASSNKSIPEGEEPSDILNKSDQSVDDKGEGVADAESAKLAEEANAKTIVEPIEAPVDATDSTKASSAPTDKPIEEGNEPSDSLKQSAQPVDDKGQDVHKEAKKICDICKCSTPCNNDCEAKKKAKASNELAEKAKEEPIAEPIEEPVEAKDSKSSTPIDKPIEEGNELSDSLKKSAQPADDKGEGVHKEAKKICEICKCSTPCNNDCEAKKKAKASNELAEKAKEEPITEPIEAKDSKSAVRKASSIPIDKPIEEGNEPSDSLKKSAQPVDDKGESVHNVTKKICEICKCATPCNNDCEAKKKAKVSNELSEEANEKTIAEPIEASVNAKKTKSVEIKVSSTPIDKSSDEGNEPSEICEICKCTTPCNNDCESKKKAKASNELAEKVKEETIADPIEALVDAKKTKSVEIKVSSTPIDKSIEESNEPSDSQNKSAQPVDDKGEGVHKESKKICEICKCTMPCNNDCEAKKIAKVTNESKKICEICKCTIPCNNKDCETKKKANASIEAKKVCEICKCTIPCNNIDCEIKKKANAPKEGKKICPICKCTVPCNNDCEFKKKTEPKETIKPPELTDDLIKTTDKSSKHSVAFIETQADAIDVESPKLAEEVKEDTIAEPIEVPVDEETSKSVEIKASSIKSIGEGNGPSDSLNKSQSVDNEDEGVADAGSAKLAEESTEQTIVEPIETPVANEASSTTVQDGNFIDNKSIEEGNKQPDEPVDDKGNESISNEKTIGEPTEAPVDAESLKSAEEMKASSTPINKSISDAANVINDGGEAQKAPKANKVTSSEKKCSCGRKICKESCSNKPCYKEGSLEGIVMQQMLQLISCGCGNLICNDTCSKKPCSDKVQIKGLECTREEPNIKPAEQTSELIKTIVESSEPVVVIQASADAESAKLAVVEEVNEEKIAGPFEVPGDAEYTKSAEESKASIKPTVDEPAPKRISRIPIRVPSRPMDVCVCVGTDNPKLTSVLKMTSPSITQKRTVGHCHCEEELKSKIKNANDDCVCIEQDTLVVKQPLLAKQKVKQKTCGCHRTVCKDSCKLKPCEGGKNLVCGCTRKVCKDSCKRKPCFKPVEEDDVSEAISQKTTNYRYDRVEQEDKLNLQKPPPTITPPTITQNKSVDCRCEEELISNIKYANDDCVCKEQDLLEVKKPLPTKQKAKQMTCGCNRTVCKDSCKLKPCEGARNLGCGCNRKICKDSCKRKPCIKPDEEEVPETITREISTYCCVCEDKIIHVEKPPPAIIPPTTQEKSVGHCHCEEELNSKIKSATVLYCLCAEELSSKIKACLDDTSTEKLKEVPPVTASSCGCNKMVCIPSCSSKPCNSRKGLDDTTCGCKQAACKDSCSKKPCSPDDVGGADPPKGVPKYIKNLIGEIRCLCKKPEIAPKFRKNETEVIPTISTLKLGLDSLWEKCKNKDIIIDSLRQELDMHTTSKVFSDMFNKVTTKPTGKKKDYDRYMVAQELPMPECLKNTPKCDCSGGKQDACCKIDPSPLQIIDIKKISGRCVLVKWIPSDNPDIIGYEICIAGVVMTRVLKREITSTVLNWDKSCSCNSVEVSIYAFTEMGRCFPPATAEYRTL